jgi:Leucine-rich repeat (LRR) protein
MENNNRVNTKMPQCNGHIFSKFYLAEENMKVSNLFQRLARALLITVIMGGFLMTPNQSTSAKPLFDPFTNCATQTQIPEAECNALVALYTSTGGDNWTIHTDWLQTDTPCSWSGVTCNVAGTNVTELVLGWNGLSAGTIPTELGSLTSLSWLDLAGNQLSGTIPTELGSLTNLAVLNLSSNQLSGTIPAELGSLTNLTVLYLDNNQLRGEIPASFVNLTSLAALTLDCGFSSPNQSVTDFITSLIPDWQTCLPVPSITSVTPNSGPASGGTSVTISGEKFTDASSVTFGGASASFIVDSDTQITATSPALAGGPPVDVAVTTPNGVATATGAFTYIETPSFTCATQTEIPVAECNALVALYNSTGGASWTDKTNWLQTDTPCSWFGVFCDAGTNVTSLSLQMNNLSGTIPTQLGSLSNLTELNLSSNQLSGAIPTQLGSLSNLTSLSLSSNQLSGAIPTQLGSLSNLTGLSLDHNQLTGTIPTQLGSLTNLQWLNLNNNQLSGTIPTQLGSLTSLISLNLSSNQLSGTIPTQLGSLTNLQWLILNNNQLSGTIPTQLGSLTSLYSLDLSGNQLSGTIPTQLGSLTGLNSLNLSGNQLSGEFPTSITNLTQLTTFAFDCWITSTDPDVITFINALSPDWQSHVCPMVSSIVRANPSPTTAASVNFTVTFSESVTGVDTAAPFNDFSLVVSSGISGALITSVVGSGPTYTVTVNAGRGSGTIRLDVTDNDSILDDDSNPLGGLEENNGNFNTGQVYTILPRYTISGKAGTGGATLKYTDVTLKTVTADASGNYSFTVPYNWSGTVTPSKAGYTFSPAYKSYTHVLANQSAQNYIATTSVTFSSTAAQDGWILESSETSNAGGTLNSALTTFVLGDNNLKRQYRSILSFPTSTLPDTAVITSVTLKIKPQSVTGGATFSMFQGLLVDIFKGTFGTSALQTTDFQSAAHRTVGPFTAPAVGGWYAFNLTPLEAYINKLATGSGLTQFRLRFRLDDNNNAIANYISFYSGNAPAAYRPQLIVQYYVP